MNDDTNLLFTFLNQVSGAKIAISVIIIVAVIVAVLLLLRNVRVWYWKTDKVIDAIDDVESRMEIIEQGMDQVKSSTQKLILETQINNEALLALEHKSQLLLEELKKMDDVSKLEMKNEIKLLQNNDKEESERAETGNPGLQAQAEELEQMIENLKKEKEQLEKDINARIRD